MVRDRSITWVRVRGGSGLASAALPMRCNTQQHYSHTNRYCLHRPLNLARCLISHNRRRHREMLRAQPVFSDGGQPRQQSHCRAQQRICKPTRVARAPHIVLPIAIPPCSTSRYIDRARALPTTDTSSVLLCSGTQEFRSMPPQQWPARRTDRQTMRCASGEGHGRKHNDGSRHQPSTEVAGAALAGSSLRQRSTPSIPAVRRNPSRRTAAPGSAEGPVMRSLPR